VFGLSRRPHRSLRPNVAYHINLRFGVNDNQVMFSKIFCARKWFKNRPAAVTRAGWKGEACVVNAGRGRAAGWKVDGGEGPLPGAESAALLFGRPQQWVRPLERASEAPDVA
jgi:hypothetical protein